MLRYTQMSSPSKDNTRCLNAQSHWAGLPEAVQIIDEDQGKSGASAQDRTGFARLAHDVAHGQVGAILAVEASRLARSSQDWQRLLSLCAVAQVAVIDENTVYDPSLHDDKLLLDLKGAMSEQELHWLSLRLAGGRLNKARRGESYVTPPTGYVWGGRGLELDPGRIGTKCSTGNLRAIQGGTQCSVATAMGASVQLPNADPPGVVAPKSLPSVWEVRGLMICFTIRYTPAFTYSDDGATSKKLVDGEIRIVRTRLDQPTDWPVRIDNAHPAYITWERYMSNQEKMRQNKTTANRASRGAPREGPALLAGVALCGRCGRRMGVRYETGSSRWYYFCYGESSKGDVYCWGVPGAPIDQAVEKLFLQTMVPSEIELSLAVEREVGSQADTLAKAWLTRIEQAGYEARRAERRYKSVDPDNRVVARTLESEWEQRLREQEAVEQQYAEARRQRRVELTAQDRERIRELSRDLSAVWKSGTTSMADRKAMVRLVIEAVALHPVDVPKRATRIRVQWQSGVVSELQVPRPGSGEHYKQSPEAVQRIRELAAAGNHEDEIAKELNAKGYRTGTGRVWTGALVYTAIRSARIKRVAPDRQRNFPLPHRYPDGRYSVPGVMARFGVSESTVYRWIRDGIIRSSRKDFGTSRNAHWIDIDEATADTLMRKHRATARKSPKV